MPSENSIHIRLDYLEALTARRNLLSSELFSLNVAKRIAAYRVLRLEEFRLKSKLYGKIKTTRSHIKALQEMLPNPKIPKILRKEQLGEKSLKEETKAKHEEGIEFQLREIQRRLEELQG
ncbi:MAG: hypothetical protein NTW17_01135 [Candidatus Pacearchaeota archaeon]|nr:hypothetical protein [Candidatus Pacearchaeota archaeon]